MENHTGLEDLPPKPPNINSFQANQSFTFKDKLLFNDSERNLSISQPPSYLLPMAVDTIEEEGKKVPKGQEDEYMVPITREDKQRIYYPWRFSVIIKLQGKKVLHQILKRKLADLWKPKETFPLIDLGEDYFTVKFNKEENMVNALQNGPWFIFGHFLSVQRWEPNFVPSKAKQILTEICVRLSQLPTEFYDGNFLEKVGNKIGRLLKVDACTSTALRGCYARLYVELPLNKAVKSNVWIGSHKQQVLYECDKLLCLNCGHLGHSTGQCNMIKQQSTNSATKEKEEKEQDRNMLKQTHKINEE
ncbi:PREDICTED: uncharacterized protein LOC109244251 [Nicotiana attenuata]|uniref:uncharacterized protein LOC109244251 n=1 Tax=Nicotiana attenuata TaxID=49451 RepID=UPI00090590B8|nr:PREDICTED: uncharacterized protein LOC109244251 [Nicotiana attenuata]